MGVPTLHDFQRYMALVGQAKALLGERAWSLLQSYGKVMAGPHSGHYVNALPPQEQLSVAEQLVAGKTLLIHLMHRHRSGNYEASSLRWRDGQLVMSFKDREEAA